MNHFFSDFSLNTIMFLSEGVFNNLKELVKLWV